MTMDDFTKKYFPKAHEKQRREKMTPEELGREMANDSLDRVEKILRSETLVR